MASINILETRGLSKSYGGVRANHNIDFSLPEGKITALIGPNGAGKSTFVGMLCGRIEASEGKVLFEGNDISHFPAHKRIGLGIAYTFQITSIFAGLSVEMNVELAARQLKARTKKAVKLKVTDVLDRIGLADRREQTAGDLSYGHKRMLEIAMGLAQEPKLFILDEPTQGLAETEIQDFIVLMKSLSAHTTILLIEHNMEVVMQTADHIAVLNFGELLAEGTPKEIHENEAVQNAYLGTTENA